MEIPHNFLQNRKSALFFLNRKTIIVLLFPCSSQSIINLICVEMQIWLLPGALHQATSLNKSKRHGNTFGGDLTYRLRNFSIWLSRSGCFTLAISVRPYRSEPFPSELFPSRNFSVLIVPVSSHISQAMKSWRNLLCSLLVANVVKSN